MKVQRRASRFVSNDYYRTSSVTEMISNIGWDSLQRRKNLARLSMMYRTVHHLVDVPVEQYLTPSISRTRGRDSLFFQLWTSITTYQHSFFLRTVILWNQLPQIAVSQKTLEAFQNQLAIPSKRHALFLTVITALYNFFILGSWASFTFLREYSSTAVGNY